MKHVTTTFLRGLFTLLPLLLSIYVFIWFITWVENFSRSFVFYFVPDSLYLPGIGAAVVFILIYLFGAVTERPWTKWGFSLLENVLLEIPIVKTVYQAIKDFTDFLKPSGGRKSNQVVVVKPAGTSIELIGLLTRDSLKDLPSPLTKENRVAVYFPMSYQFGGYTMFVPREWVHPTQMSVEDAMRSVITAWLPGQAQKVDVT
jgi:uncharacterized membrane protein